MGFARKRTFQEFVDGFWSLVEKGDGCWLWQGRVLSNGYGQTDFLGSRQQGAHRVAWQLANGPIPEGLFVLHKCDVRRCVRHDHLFLGTHQANMDDRQAKGRTRGNGYERKTHCPQGHPYDEENTKMYQGRRYCRACHTAHSLAYARKKLAAQRIT